MSQQKNKTKLDSDILLLELISDAIKSIQLSTGYGSIEIILHDGRVVQIERREKVRFDRDQTGLKNE